MVALIKICFLVSIFTGFVTAHIEGPEADFCSLSCKYSAHTVCLRKKVQCGPAQHCNSFMEFLDDDSRKYILDIHNHLRNQVALGLETRAGYQPPASNMNALTYSKKLEYVAQCLTNTCQYAHDECRITSKYSKVGQNIGIKWYEGIYDPYKVVINETIYSWYEQVTSFNPDWVKNFPDETAIQEYAQLIWANTLEVGCGLTFWAEDGWNVYFLACNYGPGGNIVGTPVYSIGTAATACQQDRPPNKRYKGLCGEDSFSKESFY